MTPLLLISGIIAPAIVWIIYFYYKDRFKPEPIFHTGLTYIMGFAAGLLCYKIYSLLSFLGLPEDASLIMDRHGLVFLGYCLGIVGILEEAIKFLPFILVVIKFNAFDERVDGIIYASVIALGFASYENFYYLPLLDGFALFGRAIASPLTHTIFSSLWGYYVGVAYLVHKYRAKTWKAAVKGLFLASVLHGLFDFFTTSSSWRFLSALVILAIWIWQIRKIEKINKEDKNPDSPSNSC